MMRTRIIRTIAVKELREALRDRRTLFMMVLLPILLYPALLVLVTQVAAVQMAELEERPSVVGVLGAGQDHPFVVALGEQPLIEVRLVDRISLREVDLAVDASGWPAELDPATAAPVRLIYAAVEDESRQALDRVEALLLDWIDAEIARRVEAAELPEAFADPLEVERDNKSTTREQGGMLLASLLPIMVLLTVLMGAYYPSIDMTAGEKERSTIQTLFTAPIASFEIVAGKYLAVVGIATLSGGANLVGMALVAGQSLVTAGELADEFDVTMSPAVIGSLALTIVLVALLFSAALMAVAVLARSFKEAQTFITPVYLLCIIPALIAQLPGIEYSPTLAMVPAVSTIVLMKQVLLEGPDLEALFLVSIGTLMWTGLALVIAARLFGQESVIIGERGTLRLIPRRAEIRPRERATIGEALAWYGVLFALLFYVGATLQARTPQVGLFVTLWFVLLAPTLAVAWYARLDLRAAFNARPARPRDFGVALLMAFGAVIVVNWLNGLIETHVLRPPDALLEELAKFFPRPERPLDWINLLMLAAVTPAICEELVFRGFLLSAVRGRIPDWAAALAIGLAFGVFHLSVYRLFGTTALGVLMTLLVLRTGSVYPAMLFHFVNNGLAVVGLAVGGEEATQMPTSLLALGVPALGLSLYLLYRPSRGRAQHRAGEPLSD